MDAKEFIDSSDYPWVGIVESTQESFFDFLYKENFLNKEYAIRWLNGVKMGRVSDFYGLFSAALQFPPYSGSNLDALYDLLCDLEWIREQRLLIGIIGANFIGREDSEGLLTKVIKLFNDVGEFYSDKPNSKIVKFLLHSENRMLIEGLQVVNMKDVGTERRGDRA